MYILWIDLCRSKNVKPEEETDCPQTELVAEVTNILDTLQVTSIVLSWHRILRVYTTQVLNNHLRKAEAAHKKLTTAKCKLEHNISVKITSINIDANILMNREVSNKANYGLINIQLEGLSTETARKLAKDPRGMFKTKRDK